MGTHWDPTPVVGDPAATIGEQHHLDAGAVSLHRLVDGVVHDLPDQMVQTGRSRGTDEHAWANPDRFQSLQDLDSTFVVARRDRPIAGPATVGLLKCQADALSPSANRSRRVPSAMSRIVPLDLRYSTWNGDRSLGPRPWLLVKASIPGRVPVLKTLPQNTTCL